MALKSLGAAGLDACFGSLSYWEMTWFWLSCKNQSCTVTCSVQIFLHLDQRMTGKFLKDFNMQEARVARWALLMAEGQSDSAGSV